VSQVVGIVLLSQLDVTKADQFFGILCLIAGVALIIHGAYRCFCRGVDFYSDGGDANTHDTPFVAGMTPSRQLPAWCAICSKQVIAILPEDAADEEATCLQCGERVDISGKTHGPRLLHQQAAPSGSSYSEFQAETGADVVTRSASNSTYYDESLAPVVLTFDK
jgi:DNA-directed RNA polymerase subunit RPC12/RpoP